MILPVNQQGLYQNGNSIFDDVHVLGTLHCDFQIGAGIVTATTFIGDGSQLTGIDASTIKDANGNTQIQGTLTGATHSGRAVFNELEVGGKLYDGDGDFGTSGQVLASDGTNTNWVNTGDLTAGAASEVGVTATNANAGHFITFVDSSSGNENIKVDSDLSYNPSTNTLSSLNIAGAVITGNLTLNGELRDGSGSFGTSGQVLSSDGTDTAWVNTGDLTAGAASEVGVTATNANATHFISFVDSSSGNENIKVDTNLTYNPSSNTLIANIFSGTATQASNLNNHDTDGLSEGSSNLYFTDARARSSISVSGDLSYNSGTGVISYNDSAAGVPSQITVADESSDTSCFLLYATAATGNLQPKTGSNLVFNSSNGVLTATNFSGGGSNITNIDAANIATGTINAARIPNLAASKITSGTLGADRIPNLAASKITSGTLGADRIPNLAASKITSGTLGTARIPNLNASKINAGTLSDARLPSSISSDITGNAATASILAIARTIAGASFNGSSDVNINYNNLTNLPTIPTNTNQLTNGSGFITAAMTGNSRITVRTSGSGTHTTQSFCRTVVAVMVGGGGGGGSARYFDDDDDGTSQGRGGSGGSGGVKFHTQNTSGSTNISFSVGGGGGVNVSGSCDDNAASGGSGGTTSFGGSSAGGGGGGQGTNFGSGSGGSGGSGDLPGAAGGTATSTPAPFWGKFGTGGKGGIGQAGNDSGCSVGQQSGQGGAIIILELG